MNRLVEVEVFLLAILLVLLEAISEILVTGLAEAILSAPVEGLLLPAVTSEVVVFSGSEAGLA